MFEVFNSLDLLNIPEKMARFFPIILLLHDIGKPLARRIEKEEALKNIKVYYRGHESISAFLSATILSDLKIPHDIRRVIIETLSFHTTLFPLMKKDAKNKTFKRMISGFVNNEVLFSTLIETMICDAVGRFKINGGEDDISFLLNTWKEKMIGEFENIPSLKKRASEKTITILVGLPCSGKTTHVELEKNVEVISRDAYIEKDAKLLGKTYNELFRDEKYDKMVSDRLKCASRGETDVFLDMTNLSQKQRRKRLQFFSSEWKKKAIVFFPRLELIKERLEKRNIERREDPSACIITPNVVSFMIKHFTPPLYVDFDEIEWKF